MECKEVNQAIIKYFEDKLEINELRSFILHMEKCKDCFEELSVQYLVREGMQRLENGDSLDLNKELNIKMEMAKRKIKQHEILDIAVKVLQIICIVSLVVFLIKVVL